MSEPTTKQLGLEAIKAIIYGGDIDKFIGVEETSYFEFREKSYFTDSAHGNKFKSQIEIVKDVTSIANSGGGLICIGLVPKRKPALNNIEYVESVCGVKEEDINLQSWIDIITSSVTPEFSVNYIQSGFIGSDKKVFWMNISDAASVKKFPFVLFKDQWLPEKDTSVNGKVMGYYYRDGAENKLHSPEAVQRYIAQGLNNELNSVTKSDSKSSEILSTIDAMRLEINALSSQVNTIVKEINFSGKSGSNNLDSKIVKYINSRIGAEVGYFYLHAAPKQPVKIDNFWDDGGNSIRNLIKNPPHIREHGWDLRVAFQEFPSSKNDAWEIMNGDRKLLRVQRDGEVIAAGAIDGFLDWGVEIPPGKDEEPVSHLINAFALTEYVDAFFHFLAKFRQQFAEDTDYLFICGFVLSTNVIVRLHRPSQLGHFFNPTSEPLTDNKWRYELILPAKDEKEPAFLAGEVMIEVNASAFGWPDKPFAYILSDENGNRVNEEFYIKQR